MKQKIKELRKKEVVAGDDTRFESKLPGCVCIIATAHTYSYAYLLGFMLLPLSCLHHILGINHLRSTQPYLIRLGMFGNIKQDYNQ